MSSEATIALIEKQIADCDKILVIASTANVTSSKKEELMMQLEILKNQKIKENTKDFQKDCVNVLHKDFFQKSLVKTKTSDAIRVAIYDLKNHKTVSITQSKNYVNNSEINNLIHAFNEKLPEIIRIYNSNMSFRLGSN